MLNSLFVSYKVQGYKREGNSAKGVGFVRALIRDALMFVPARGMQPVGEKGRGRVYAPWSWCVNVKIQFSREIEGGYCALAVATALASGSGLLYIALLSYVIRVFGAVLDDNSSATFLKTRRGDHCINQARFTGEREDSLESCNE